LKALVEYKIPINCIAGTSAGSLVGGAMASGMSLSDIETIGRSLRWRDVGRMTMSRQGVQTNDRLEQYLKDRLPVTRFENLPIPFAAVATDLHSGKAVVLRDKGDVPFAIRASCAIPGWYVPVTDDQGKQLVDGGLVAMVPSTIARSLGADVVIAIDVNAEAINFLGPSLSIISVLLQSMLLVQRSASLHQLEQADFVIKPRVGHIRLDEMQRAEELIAAGYQAAVESIPEIELLIESARRTHAKWYKRWRQKSVVTKHPITSPT
jgi:NTE family protein